MRIEVQAFATLVSFLPEPGRNAGSAPLEVPEGSTVADVATALGIPDAFPRITLVNGEDAGPDRRLAGGDVVTFFPPLAGGGPSRQPVDARR